MSLVIGIAGKINYHFVISLHNFFFLLIYRGQSPADAEFNFLDHAKRLDLYGVDLHKARVIMFFYWFPINVKVNFEKVIFLCWANIVMQIRVSSK